MRGPLASLASEAMSSSITFGYLAQKWKGTVLCSGFTILLLIIILSASVVQVDRLKAGLLKNGITGEVDLEKAYLPGRYFFGFWYQVVSFPTTLNTIEFSDETPEDGVAKLGKLISRDRDGKQVFLDLTVQYRIFPEKLPEIYREMTILYEDVYTSELRGRFQQAFNNFPIAQVWEKYTEVQAFLLKECRAVLLVRHAECWGLQLWGVRLQPQYEQALVNTQVQKQAKVTAIKRQNQTSLRAKTTVELAAYLKNQTVIRNKGQADKLQIVRRAKSESQAALIFAQGEVLGLVSDLVRLPERTGPSPRPEIRLNGSALVHYQRILMMTDQKNSNFVVRSSRSYMKSLAIPAR